MLASMVCIYKDVIIYTVLASIFLYSHGRSIGKEVGEQSNWKVRAYIPYFKLDSSPTTFPELTDRAYSLSNL